MVSSKVPLQPSHLAIGLIGKFKLYQDCSGTFYTDILRSAVAAACPWRIDLISTENVTLSRTETGSRRDVL